MFGVTALNLACMAVAGRVRMRACLFPRSRHVYTTEQHKYDRIHVQDDANVPCYSANNSTSALSSCASLSKRCRHCIRQDSHYKAIRRTVLRSAERINILYAKKRCRSVPNTMSLHWSHACQTECPPPLQVGDNIITNPRSMI